MGSARDIANGHHESLGRPRYDLDTRLAVGGMAEILLGRLNGAHGFSKQVVIKRILPHYADEKSFVDMFLDEARLSSRFNHPNLINVYDLTELDGRPSMVMEYLEGYDSSNILEECDERKVQVPLGVAAHIVAQAAAGLHYAHELRDDQGELLNVVHRDISPGNLIITTEGNVKVVDFGIAKHHGRQTKTEAYTLKGKLTYMSPEQADAKTIDRRSDVFSLGIVLWELVTGQPCFDGDTMAKILASVIKADVPSARRYRKDIPEELAVLLREMLHANPKKRIPDCRTVQTRLEAIFPKLGNTGPAAVVAFTEELFGDDDIFTATVMIDAKSIFVGTSTLADPAHVADVEDYEKLHSSGPVGKHGTPRRGSPKELNPSTAGMRDRLNAANDNGRALSDSIAKSMLSARDDKRTKRRGAALARWLPGVLGLAILVGLGAYLVSLPTNQTGSSQPEIETYPLSLKVSPRNVSLTLNGAPLTAAELGGGIQLDTASEQVLEIRPVSSKFHPATIRLGPDLASGQRVELRPKKLGGRRGQIEIQTGEIAAEVWVGNQVMGPTPLRFWAPEGEIELEIRHPDFGRKRTKVTVAAGSYQSRVVLFDD